MAVLTVKEYSAKIGAKLKPTCLEDMAVLDVQENDQPENFFAGGESIKTWLEVNDPSGGLNGDGYWPFVVTESDSGELSVFAQSY